MNRSLTALALLVRDYDEAIAYYTGSLGFTLLEDADLGGGKRWVRVTPGSGGATLLLAKATSPHQLSRVGDQTGGRVFLFLDTDDCERDYRTFSERGVCFDDPPRHETYGIVAVFTDLYGNRWDLVERVGRRQ